MKLLKQYSKSIKTRLIVNIILIHAVLMGLMRLMGNIK